MKFVAEANLQASKYLSQTRNITELMSSIFKRLRLWSMANQKLLELAQNALEQQRKRNNQQGLSPAFLF